MSKKFCFSAFLIVLALSSQVAIAKVDASNYMSENAYNNLYPYMNNEMRTRLNPGTSPTLVNSQIDVLARTKDTPATKKRMVISRTPQAVRKVAPSGNNIAAYRNFPASVRNYSRMAYPRQPGTQNLPNRRAASRRAVPRERAFGGAKVPLASNANRSRATIPLPDKTEATPTEAAQHVSSARCLADYTECMNRYCERKDTPYNRCYCSSKLSQIDSQYKPAIEELLNQIIMLGSENHWTNEEMNEYWMEKIGQYVGENSWVKLENALNINWAGLESRVRGQNAFMIGHEYCVQHLRGCFYMATNLRDAYRSEISRDCANYESSLQRIKNAAESILESQK